MRAMAESRRMVYFFGGGKADGRADMKELLGGKGANLAEMTNLGIPVPPGFTITTEVCRYYQEHKGKYPPGLRKEIDANLRRLEKAMGAGFGDAKNPLLVSVRSGAAISMPGMMDTVLNLGLNEETLQGMIRKTGNEKVAWDSYRRFITMFGDVVMGIEHEKYEAILARTREREGVKTDPELSVGALKRLVAEYKALYRRETGEEFPADPKEQLNKAINAVFGSWNNPRAITYRRLNKITGLLGTAVNVQAMVFGNMGETSATGVAFTRDPSTGANRFYGEYLVNAQGEDVVAGIRTPEPISKLARRMPRVYKELVAIKNRLEQHYREIQDLEFTIQEGRLFILQTRNGKRTAHAAVKIAVDMVKEKLIAPEEAVARIQPDEIDQLLHPTFDPKAERNVVAKGLPASPGAAVGQVVFTAESAEAWAGKGKDVILCRTETSPEDIGGMHVARGILTSRGGMTSHAAVVARGMGTPCVAGCGAIQINYSAKRFKVGGQVVKEGDYISIDGSAGEVMLGRVPTIEPKMSGNFGRLMAMADKIRTLGVRTNADTPDDARRARAFGAEGIGLCRTEHMFFGEGRIDAMRQLILVAGDYRALPPRVAEAEAAVEALKKELHQVSAAVAEEFERVKKLYLGALKKLLPMQRKDFEGIFTAMKGLPVTIRLLDPPLHEFLPQEEENQRDMAKVLGVKPEVVKTKVAELHEINPMLGHRGCRLGLTYPEVTDMQVRAILEAACNLKKKGVRVLPEIMIPLIGTAAEFDLLKERTDRVAETVFKET